MQKASIKFKLFATIFSLILSSSLLSSCQYKEDASPDIPEIPTLQSLVASAKGSPEVSASSAIGIETSSGEIFYAKSIDEKLPMASTTKIMTAIIALERGSLDDTVKIDSRAVGVEGSSIYLFEGEILSLEHLLYAMLLESANDAASAIAIHIAGSIEGFSLMMNEKATALGLCNTHFDNPHGLDSENHFTTARELAQIAAYAMKNPDFRRIVSTKKETIPLDGKLGARVLINHNKLLRSYDGAIGIKTGYTKKSGRCLVSASLRDGVELICVTLNAPSDWQDHKSILDFGNSLYELKTQAAKGDILATLLVVGGKTDKLSVCVEEDIMLATRKNANIEAIIEAPRLLFAPISKGQAVGKILYIQDGKVLMQAPLVATEDIEKVKGNSKLFKNFSK